MSCPQCGDVCRCEPQFRLPQASPRALRPRFELDSCDPVRTTALIDPEAYDTSEERFSASLEERPSASPRFVLDVRETGQNEPSSELSDRAHTPTPQAASSLAEEELPAVEVSPSSAPPATDVPTDPSQAEVTPDSWKDEVAARLNSYRARRKPKPPRYPSLRLKFDTPESRTPVRPTEAAVPAHMPDNLAPAAYEPEPASLAPEPRFQPPPETARIIEFPRSLYEPPPVTYELAEPVSDAPRILEVPEAAPPPPALGGISLPAEEKEPERRPGFEIPLQTPPLSRRVLAMSIDATIVSSAAALFGYIVFRICGLIPVSLSVVETVAAVLAVLAAGYEYLLLIYTGSTPGLRLAHLRLSRFDGGPVPRRMRQWRVLASILSAASLGLGFAWSYVDEDSLCWHDRITRTYLAPTP